MTDVLVVADAELVRFRCVVSLPNESLRVVGELSTLPYLVPE